jgi:glycosyltransferase involved in cell wall biosynthesis
MPAVSIILPTYNRAKTLVRAIESVLKQTFDDFELLIIDDGSSDDTKQRVKPFLTDVRVKYLYQDNAGASAARNKGIELSVGEFIAFQDSDDEWLSTKLAEQVEIFKKNDNSLALVYCDMLRINSDGSEFKSYAPDVTNGELFNQKTMEYQVFGIGIQSCLIRKQHLLEVGGFDQSFPRFIDLELFIRLSKIAMFHRIKTILVKYYATEGISTNARNLAIARELLVNKYQDEAQQNPASLANQYLRIAGCYWSLQEKALSVTYCKKVLKTADAKVFTKIKALIVLLTPWQIGKVLLGR